MKKYIALALSMVLALGTLSGCGATGSKETEKDGMTAMVVMIPQGDPFLQLAYAGVQQFAEESGKEAKIIEALDKSEYSEQVRAMAEAGANPIYVVWDDLAEEAFKIAPEFPDTKFIAVDTYATCDAENVMALVAEPQEAAFVAGVLAVHKTESGKVAWIGNMDIPEPNRFRYGFEAGVAYADPSVTVESVYIGDSNDPNKGAELAKQLIDKGNDVVMQTANQAGLGVIRACEENQVFAIGADKWQGEINEDIVFWSALKDIKGATYAAGISTADGTFSTGVHTYGLNEGAALYDQRDYDKLSDELKKEVDTVVEKITSGEIVVPYEDK